MDCKALGARIAEAVDAKGMNTKQFASCMGVSYSTASSYMRGDRVPTLDRLVRICWLLGTSADHLLGLR